MSVCVYVCVQHVLCQELHQALRRGTPRSFTRCHATHTLTHNIYTHTHTHTHTHSPSHSHSHSHTHTQKGRILDQKDTPWPRTPKLLFTLYLLVSSLCYLFFSSVLSHPSLQSFYVR